MLRRHGVSQDTKSENIMGLGFSVWYCRKKKVVSNLFATAGTDFVKSATFYRLNFAVAKVIQMLKRT